ncbi:hypothetical protein KY290_025989 [Solanum tuberosum]|uniref:Uncharacterized protein n=1 Tax=Solanum tuberosum TaxID=4113 RepID=A0ABQ7UV97_SOLTU|nr:hypothetical protein KY290_025989 [Solanum tuberosum]
MRDSVGKDASSPPLQSANATSNLQTRRVSFLDHCEHGVRPTNAMNKQFGLRERGTRLANEETQITLYHKRGLRCANAKKKWCCTR